MFIGFDMIWSLHISMPCADLLGSLKPWGHEFLVGTFEGFLSQFLWVGKSILIHQKVRLTDSSSQGDFNLLYFWWEILLVSPVLGMIFEMETSILIRAPGVKLPSLKRTAVAPKNWPGPKRKLVFQPPTIHFVSFRECFSLRKTLARSIMRVDAIAFDPQNCKLSKRNTSLKGDPYAQNGNGIFT